MSDFNCSMCQESKDENVFPTLAFYKCITWYFLKFSSLELFNTIFFSLESISKTLVFFKSIMHFYYPPCNCPQAKHCCFVISSIFLAFWLILVFILNFIFLWRCYLEMDIKWAGIFCKSMHLWKILRYRI